MKIQNYSRGMAFTLALIMVITTLFGGLGFVGIEGAVEEVYADPSLRTTTLDLSTGAGISIDMLAAEGWAWNGTTTPMTLTLSGINLSTASEIGIKVPDGVSIIVTGANTVESATTTVAAVASGIYSLGNLTITGDGTLTVTGGATTGNDNHSYGIYSQVKTVISGAALNINAYSGYSYVSSAIYSHNIEINSGTVNAVGGGSTYNSVGLQAVWDGGYIVINGGNINATGGAVTSSTGTTWGIHAQIAMTVNGGIVNGVGGSADQSSIGIYSNNVSINAGTLNGFGGIAGQKSTGISANDVFIDGGAVTASGGNNITSQFSYGIDSENVSISEGTVTATGGIAGQDSTGINLTDDFSASGGTVTATAESANPRAIVLRSISLSAGIMITSPSGAGLSMADMHPEKYIATVSGGAIAATSVTIESTANKAIDTFNFNGLDPDVTGTVNEVAKTIALTVPYGTNVTALVPTVTHTGASVSPNTGVAQNFTSPVTYTVTAADASTQTYTVTVTVAANSAKAISAFNFNGLDPDVTGTVNEGAKTIKLTVPNGTDVTALVPTITHTGASVSPNTGVAQNFTSPVTYTVTAADTSTQEYEVTVTVAAGGDDGNSGGSGGSSATTVINTNTGAVSQNQIDTAVGAARDGGTVTIQSGKTNEVSFPASGLDSLIEKDNSLTIVTDNGTLTFDGKAVSSMGTQAAGSDIEVFVEKVEKETLTDDQQAIVGDKSVYDFSVLSGGELISDFKGGKVTVNLPYELKDGETAENLTVWYLADDGTLTEISCVYDEKTKTVTFVVDHFSKYLVGYDSLATWNNPFMDIKSSDWFYGAVGYVSINALMNGQTSTQFAPEAAMTRGMFVAILGRMENVDTAMYANQTTFSDVRNNQYYAPYTAWANEKGIVSGMGSGKFAPDAAITREQMAAMMTNYMKFKGQGPVGAWAIQLSYGDLDQVSSWAGEGVMFMTMKSIMNGMGKDANGEPVFSPLSTSTRAQAATMLKRLAESN